MRAKGSQLKIAIFGNKRLTYSFFRDLLDLAECAAEQISLVTLSRQAMQGHSISGVDENIENSFAMAGANVLPVDRYDLSGPNEELKGFLSDVDFGFSIGWQRIIPKPILSRFRVGLFGWHASPFRLPNGSGRSPINWAIRLGFEETWLNCFRYSEFVDKGPIFNRTRVSIAQSDYISDIISKVLKLQVVDAARLIAIGDEVTPALVPQPGMQALWFPKLSDADGELQPCAMYVENALNIVRATSHPFPGAWVRLGDVGSFARVWSATVADERWGAVLSCPGGGVIDGKLWIKFLDGFLVSDHFDIVGK